MTRQDLLESPLAIGMLAATVVFYLLMIKSLARLLQVDVLLKVFIDPWKNLASFLLSAVGLK